MPNWCSNYVIFTHADDALLQRLADAYNESLGGGEGGTMQAFWPCPQELRDTVAGSLGDEEQQQALVAKQAANVEKYGSAHWYDWCCDNWGTKWDFSREPGTPEAVVRDNGDHKSVEIGFDTAWSPPLGFYQHMHDVFGFDVKAYYFEAGVGFVGSSRNGDENTINIREFTQDWLEDNVPEKLCKIFNLYEEAAQMEEQNGR